METAIGFSNIISKPKLKTHVQAPKYIGARLISSSFPDWWKEPRLKTLNSVPVFFTYQTGKFRDQSTLRSSTYRSSNL